MRKILAYIIFGFLLIGCSGEQTDENPDVISEKPAARILSPKNEQQYTTGDLLEIEIEVSQPERIQQLALYIDDTLYQTLDAVGQIVKIDTKNGRVGFINVQLRYTADNDKEHSDNRKLTFFSDLQPGYKTVKILNTYPHSQTSYTQGLEFYQGAMYEGTGQYGSSILARVDLSTGNHLQNIPIESQYFGEGITILNDTIYQITYRSGKCFMYDMNFKRIGEFSYEGEGWGLCNDGISLIMSNGSSELVWRNPRTFEITKRIQVFEPSQDVVSLNELEIINGHIFANIYQDKKIVEIDPATGKVINFIDCNALVVDGQIPGADVLNGIAYNPSTGKTYMTGKLWPKLYEVTFE